MTPQLCRRHRLRPGELADSPRYLAALIDSDRCWRCRLRFRWALVCWLVRGEP